LSSRPSRPAASHDTLQPRLSPQSGSTPHERGRRITHPYRQARLSLVKTQPRRRSTEQRPVSAFHGAFGHENHPLRCSSRPETHQRPLSRGCHALAPRVHRDQIAIARRPPTQPPARSFTGGFRTTAAVQAEASRWAVIRNPSQKRKCPGSRRTSVLLRSRHRQPAPACPFGAKNETACAVGRCGVRRDGPRCIRKPDERWAGLSCDLPSKT
jgi:hypothetical protein